MTVQQHCKLPGLWSVRLYSTPHMHCFRYSSYLRSPLIVLLQHWLALSWVVMDESQQCLSWEDDPWHESRMRVGVPFCVTGSEVRRSSCLWPQWQPLLWARMALSSDLYTSVMLTVFFFAAGIIIITLQSDLKSLVYECSNEAVCRLVWTLLGGEADRAAGWEGRGPGRAVPLRHGLRWQQGEGCVRGPHPLRIQLPGQGLCHFRDHRVKNWARLHVLSW